ncbi:AMP-binding protein [Sabulicella glaciei]|uniref:AMP-binding protein n=1 Tax=Sabulicella glaciei TaxID=2984948 RepID=A0ABT3NRB3_9PROT|nr:AMP-binding protein [Roseococcus sp. MDT2-1-1]MCW8084702.1 AMP-binding protein [Roseococcus sp. MDT2-1-1]
MTDDTLPRLLARNAARHANEIALREKHLGIWRSFTWADYQARVRGFALGLASLGIRGGDAVGLIGDNRPDWVMGEVAAHALGCRTIGIYRDSMEEEVEFLLAFTGASVVFAEDEEQVDKLLSIGDRLPGLRHIVFTDPRGMRKLEDPRLVSAEELLRRGAERPEREYAALVQATRGEDVAILCTTSGTTARPKLAQLTSSALIRHCEAYLAADPKGPQDEYVSVLPLPWIMEQIYAVGWNLISRMKVNFVEEPETTMADFREIGPTFVLFAPRTWEALAAEVRARVMDASPLKRRMFDLGMNLGLQALEKGGRSAVADGILFRALRDRLGFTNLRSAATGGAALGPDTFRFFLALGVPLRQLYGQTETLGAYTLQAPGRADFETVGTPFNEQIELRVNDPDANGVGEIVTRHPHMFTGYFGVAETPDLRDGWLHTGDAGYFDAKGRLVVIDRIKDIATTSTGTRFSPQYIENKLKFSPYVAEAVVLGDGRPHLAAMICIRFPIVSKWAERNRIAFTTYTDLSARQQVQTLIAEEVAKVNATLPEAQRIRDFVLLYKELDADDEELTRTRKVRRGVINQKYGDIIAAIYGGQGEIPVDTTITFQDGSRSRIRTTLTVQRGDAAPAKAA